MTLILKGAITPPKWPVNDRDQHCDCPLALDVAFQALAAAAEEAGWSGDEVAFALLHLAGMNLKKRATDASTRDAIARAEREAQKRFASRA